MGSDREADWLSVAEARSRVLSGVRPLEAEPRALLSCLRYVLAEDVRAPLDLPPWDNSAMDGFAVRAVDIAGATAERPRELPVAEDVPAGAAPAAALEPGTAVRVMTGAPVPAGADTVVRIEHTDGAPPGPGGWRVRVLSDSDAGANIRKRGEDIERGALVLRGGTPLRPAEIGVAASMGRAELRVVRRPVVAVLTSGDELVDLDGFGEVLEGRRIVSSNTYSLSAQLAEIGMEVRNLGIAADSPRALRDALERARGCDALVTSAGISMGEHDLVLQVLDELGVRLAFWRVKMRPGSPVAFGHVDALGGIPWFGLPGNPVSSMVTFEVFVRPALLRMSGRGSIFHPTVRARLQDAFGPAPGLTHFARVRLGGAGDELEARLSGSQGSGVLTSMAAADALLVVPEGRDRPARGDHFPALVLGGAPLRAEPGY